MPVSILLFACGPKLAGKPTDMGNDAAVEPAKSVKARPKSLLSLPSVLPLLASLSG